MTTQDQKCKDVEAEDFRNEVRQRSAVSAVFGCGRVEREMAYILIPGPRHEIQRRHDLFVIECLPQDSEREEA